MKEPQIKKVGIRITIAVLSVLLFISITGLAGRYIYMTRFAQNAAGYVEVPGNIITPDSKNNLDAANDTLPGDEPGDVLPDNDVSSDNNVSPDKNNTTASPSQDDTHGTTQAAAAPPASETPEAAPTDNAKAKVFSLHSKNPGDNMPFEVANMFPGDLITRYYCIKVSYKGDIIVRYHADIRPNSDKLSEVLKIKVRLLGGELLYDGLMRDMPASLDHILCTDKSTQSELYYEITVYLDTSVGNEYTNKALISDFRWWVEESEYLDPPYTGDTSNIYLWLCLAIGSLFFLILLLARHKKEKGDENE